MRTHRAVVALVVSSLLWSTSAIAQQRHIVDASALQQAAAAQALTDQQNRDAVLGVLQRPEVGAVAARLGLNVSRAESALATLTGAELASLAGQARAVDADLAGGADTIVISVTTLLLILLIVILIAR